MRFTDVSGNSSVVLIVNMYADMARCSVNEDDDRQRRPPPRRSASATQNRSPSRTSADTLLDNVNDAPEKNLRAIWGYWRQRRSSVVTAARRPRPRSRSVFILSVQGKCCCPASECRLTSTSAEFLMISLGCRRKVRSRQQDRKPSPLLLIGHHLELRFVGLNHPHGRPSDRHRTGTTANVWGTVSLYHRLDAGIILLGVLQIRFLRPTKAKNRHQDLITINARSAREFHIRPGLGMHCLVRDTDYSGIIHRRKKSWQQARRMSSEKAQRLRCTNIFFFYHSYRILTPASSRAGDGQDEGQQETTGDPGDGDGASTDRSEVGFRGAPLRPAFQICFCP